MKKYFIIFGITITTTLGMAQTVDNDLRKQVEELSQIVKKQQQQIDQQQEQIQILQHRESPSSSTASISTVTHEIETVAVAASQSPPIATPSWRPNDPIRLTGSGKNYLNISFDGLFAVAASTAPDIQNLETGGHDPTQRGFTVQNLETILEGAVDPYFTGKANFVTQINRAGETTFEAEEAFLQTSSLPANLQAKAGLYFTSFGRLNSTHPHAWDFADQPLVNGRLLGPDGLRNPGAQLSYLTPLPWYSELILSVQNGTGETATSFRNRGEGNVFFGRPTLDREVRGPSDLLHVPRWVNSFDLNDEQTVVLGTSTAFGPNNTGGDASTQIYGVDAFYKWKPSHASGGFPFVKWQTEAMYRRYEAEGVDFDNDGDGIPDTALPPREVFDDWGAYSQVLWGFSKGWVAGVRGDYLKQDASLFTADATRDTRWRFSPNLTWYPTEFSKIRLQFNHDDIGPGPMVRGRTEETLILQFEFLLGSHGAHKF